MNAFGMVIRWGLLVPIIAVALLSWVWDNPAILWIIPLILLAAFIGIGIVGGTAQSMRRVGEQRKRDASANDAHARAALAPPSDMP